MAGDDALPWAAPEHADAAVSRPQTPQEGRTESAALRFVVPGVPCAWARAGRGAGARGPGGIPVTFTPAKQRNWRATAQVYMAQARAGKPLLEQPIRVTIDAVWPRPANVPKRLGTARRPRPSRPDADNVGKMIMDAAIGVLYGDDAIVADLRVRKWIAAAGEGPAVEVLVEPIAG